MSNSLPTNNLMQSYDVSSVTRNAGSASRRLTTSTPFESRSADTDASADCLRTSSIFSIIVGRYATLARNLATSPFNIAEP